MADLPEFFYIVSKEPEEYNIIDDTDGAPIITTDAIPLYGTGSAKTSSPSLLIHKPRIYSTIRAYSVIKGMSQPPETEIDSPRLDIRGFVSGTAHAITTSKAKWGKDKALIKHTCRARASFYAFVLRWPLLRSTVHSKASVYGKPAEKLDMFSTAASSSLAVAVAMAEETEIRGTIQAKAATVERLIWKFNIYAEKVKAVSNFQSKIRRLYTYFRPEARARSYIARAVLIHFEDMGGFTAAAKSSCTGGVYTEPKIGLNGTIHSLSNVQKANMDTRVDVVSLVTAYTKSSAYVYKGRDLISTVHALSVSYSTTMALDKTIFGVANGLSRIQEDLELRPVLISTAKGAGSSSAVLAHKEYLSILPIKALGLSSATSIRTDSVLFATAKAKASVPSEILIRKYVSVDIKAWSKVEDAKLRPEITFIPVEIHAATQVGAKLFYAEQFSGTAEAEATVSVKWAEHIAGGADALGAIQAELTNNIYWIYSTVHALSDSVTSIDYKLLMNATVDALGNVLAKIIDIVPMLVGTTQAVGHSTASLDYREDVSGEAKGVGSSNASLRQHWLLFGTAHAEATTPSELEPILSFGTASAASKARVSAEMWIPLVGMTTTAHAATAAVAILGPTKYISGTVEALADFRAVYGPGIDSTAKVQATCSANLKVGILKDLGKLSFELYY